MNERRQMIIQYFVSPAAHNMQTTWSRPCNLENHHTEFYFVDNFLFSSSRPFLLTSSRGSLLFLLITLPLLSLFLIFLPSSPPPSVVSHGSFLSVQLSNQRIFRWIYSRLECSLLQRYLNFRNRIENHDNDASSVALCKSSTNSRFIGIHFKQLAAIRLMSIV